MMPDGQRPPVPSAPSTESLSAGEDTQPLLGQLGQYDLLFKLGEGGMGQVFKARHRLMDQVVALKIIHSSNLNRSDAVERFHREIRALSKLTHPNIVRAQYADFVDGKHFLVMEYVAGPNLAEVVRDRGPLPVAEACAYIQQTAQGLQHAHEQGLVHRDIKPSNLLLAPGGLVKMLDLGLALIREGPTKTQELTATGQVFGTYDYMAPEQWDDSHGVDIRADLYSLGCTLHYLLTGHPPFAGPEYASAFKKMRAHTSLPVPPIRQARADVPQAAETILDRLLAKEPTKRFGSPAELADALQPISATLPQFPPSTIPSSAPVASFNQETKTLPAPATANDKESRLPPTASRTWRRGAVLMLGVSILAIVAGGLIYWKTHRTGLGEEPAALPPLKIAKFEILHYRVKDNELLAPLRIDALTQHAPVHPGDKVKVEIHLSEAAHGFLIVLNPDGKRHLLFPAETNVLPPRQKEFVIPPKARNLYQIDGAVGLEAFVFVASRNPLPTFEEWRTTHGPLPWKRGLNDDFSWYGDSGRLEPIDAKRGLPLAGPDAISALEKLRDHLKDLPDVEIFAFIVIPVEKPASAGKK